LVELWWESPAQAILLPPPEQHERNKRSEREGELAGSGAANATSQNEPTSATDPRAAVLTGLGGGTLRHGFQYGRRWSWRFDQALRSATQPRG
jgi:hypothetical protein